MTQAPGFKGSAELPIRQYKHSSGSTLYDLGRNVGLRSISKIIAIYIGHIMVYKHNSCRHLIANLHSIYLKCF